MQRFALMLAVVCVSAATTAWRKIVVYQERSEVEEVPALAGHPRARLGRGCLSDRQWHLIFHCFRRRRLPVAVKP